MSLSADKVWFNGVNYRTGGYLFEPERVEDVQRFVRNAPEGREDLARLWRMFARQPKRPLAVRYGFDGSEVASSGWGLVLPDGISAEVKEALGPLLELRKEQAGDRYRVLEVHPNEEKSAFLERLKVRSDGPVDPMKVPYYLLLVGGPDEISFEFQYALDVQYAVGRLCFEKPEEYAAYAKAVVEAETGGWACDPRAVVFAVRNPGDAATDLSATRLARPLARELGRYATRWTVEHIDEARATKPALAERLSGAGVPTLLLTASHGLGTPADDPEQRALQGALVCQEWDPARDQGHPASSELYLAGRDIRPGADLQGLIAVFVGCYSAGTPRTDDYWFRHGDRHRVLAPRPFVASLPQRLLAQGALAVLGHVDRGWSSSFAWSGRRITDPAIYLDLLRALVDGHPVGFATEPLGHRCAELATEVHETLTSLEDYSADHLHTTLSEQWTAYNDARGMIVLGDPAARLSVSKARRDLAAAPAERIQIRAQSRDEARTAPRDLPGAPPVASAGGTSEQPSVADGRPHPVSPQPGEKDPPDTMAGVRVGEESGLKLEELERSLHAALRQALVGGFGFEVAVYRQGDAAVTLTAPAAGDPATSEGLALLTRVGPDGRITVLLPEPDADPPASVWRAHHEAVRLLGAHRLEVFKTAADILARLRRLASSHE